ncbi:hypothetical protein JCM8097_006858 [Rhodosporidiobolus ruineniae]
MPTLLSLPVELLSRIVDEAVSPFTYTHWPQRALRLRSLCLTCKTLHAVADSVLYNSLVLLDPVNVNRLLDTLEKRFSGTNTIFEVDRVIVGRQEPPVVEFDWDDNPLRPPAADYDLEALLRLVRPRHLATTLEFETCGFAHVSRQAQHELRLPSVRRLSFFGCTLPNPELLLLPPVFPNLVSLADTTGNRFSESDPDYDPFYWIGDPQYERDVPLLPQLAAVSFDWLDLYQPHVHNFTVYDVFWGLDVGAGPEEALAFSPKLKVLRLACRFGRQLCPQTPLDVVAALTSPFFRPQLLELHLVGFNTSAPACEQAFERLRNWAEERQVRLFVEADGDDDEPFNVDLWRFLDGVRRRTGLEV